MPYSKEALIILYSENKVILKNGYIEILEEEKIDFKKYKEDLREWFKCAYYLGIIFSKSSKEKLSYYLGVDIK